MWLPLKDLISAKVKQAGLAKQLEATGVVEWFNQNRADVVGERLAPYVQAAYVRNKALTIACPSAVAMQEVRVQEGAIIARVQRKFGSEVERIRFTVG